MTILYLDTWAVLEVKRSSTAPSQPNQDYYVRVLGDMGYSNYVYPENKEEVIDELQHAFRPTR